MNTNMALLDSGSTVTTVRRASVQLNLRQVNYELLVCGNQEAA